MFLSGIRNLGTWQYYYMHVQCRVVRSLNNDPPRTAVNHNKAAGFERRLELYLMENFKHAFDMERFGVQL